MLSTFPISFSLLTSLCGIGCASPVRPQLNANVVAPAATPAAWNVRQEITGTGTPTNYPTTITNIATSTESYERTFPNPLGGQGYGIRTDITWRIYSTREEWPARVTSVPYPVKGAVVETDVYTMNNTYYLTGYAPVPFTMGGKVTDTPYESWTLDLRYTTFMTDNPRVVEFSLTSFPTSFTKTYTSTSTLTYQEVQTTYVVVETITESWSAQPTSLPYTLTQRAVARTWRGNSSVPFGLRTFEPKFTVGSLPTPVAEINHQGSQDPRILARIPEYNNGPKADIEKRQMNSIYPLVYAFTTLPANLPTTLTASSTVDITTATTLVSYNAMLGPMNYSIDVTAHITETWYEEHPSAPTSFPYSVTGSIVGTTTTSSTIYRYEWTWGPPYPCQPPSPASGCPTLTPATPGTPTQVDSYTSSQTNTWTWTKVYHFSFTSGPFPTTVTKVYTSTRGIEETTVEWWPWKFSMGPILSSDIPSPIPSSTQPPKEATTLPEHTHTRPVVPRPTAAATTLAKREPTVYNITYIDVSTIIETWESKPTNLPTAVTHTGNVSHLSIMTISPGGLTATGESVEKVFPTMVVGSIKEGLQRPNGNLSWEILPFL